MIGDDLKLWQKAALLLAAPLILEIVVFGAIFQAQQQVKQAQLNERVSADQMYDTDIEGLRLTLDSLCDIYAFHTGGKPWTLTRCKIKLVKVKALRERLKSVPGYKNSALQNILGEVEESLKKTIYTPDADFMELQIKSIRQTSYMLTRAVKASELTHADLLKEHTKLVEAVDEKENRFRVLFLIGLFTTTLFALCLGLVYHKGTDIQIRTLLENIQRLSRREKLLDPLSGDNELAILDRVFHSMANDIESLTARERSVLANSNELILLISEDMKINLASASSAQILERSEKDMIGLRVSAFTPKFVEQLQETKARGENRFELDFTNPSGKLVELEVSASWSESEQFYYCVGHNIGARKELERMKQNFISMVSHDLRSPIAASQAALQLLTSDTDSCKLSDDGTKIVNRMMASNTRLLGMITDLLDMEKLDYGLIGLDYELVTFNDLMYECMNSIEILATAKNIKVTLDDSDKFIYCDSARIVQVVVNIASNAVKVSKSGSEIEFRFRETEDYSVVSIIDHGPGIPADFIPQLFDRFTQVAAYKEVARQGSGLGLSVAKKLVDLHNGTIEVFSVIGKGTTFDVSIPLNKMVSATLKSQTKEPF